MVLVLAGLLTEKREICLQQYMAKQELSQVFQGKGKKKGTKRKNTEAARKASSEVLGLRSSSLICSVTTYLNLYKYHSL